MKDLKDILKNWKGKKILMTVFPHPDDETMAAGGLLLIAKKLGWKTVVVTLTRGEAGKLFVNTNGYSASEVRERELKNAIKILGADKLILGDFPDGKLRRTKIEWKSWLKKIIKEKKPGIVVTYDHTGFTGHPDHIVLSVELTSLIKKLKVKPALFWTAREGRLKKMVNPKVAAFAAKPTHILDVGWSWYRKWLASRAHRSQKLGKSPLWLLLAFALYHYEWYHKVDLTEEHKYKFVEFKI
jgi:LmbE family N-acetylglucosaminyl deacetylase